MEVPLLKEVVIIFCLSILVIFLCLKIKIPPIVGFLLTGIVCGPYGLGLVSAAHEVEMLAEMGVVLLMFSIGMELSIGELIRLRKPVFLGGALQVGLTIVVMGAFSMLFVGRPLNQGVFVGCLAALSSTAIVLKIMQQNGQIESPHGRITLSILIFQDLVIVPMVLAVPMLAGTGLADGMGLGPELLLSGLKTLGIIVGGFLLARKVLPKLLSMIVRTRSRELFLISTLACCLSIAMLTSMLGLSLSLGAFLAGLIMSESEYSHSALEGVMPFKEVFTSLFFISVGMLLNLNFFFAHLPGVLVGTVLLIVVKSVVVTGVGLLLGYPLRTSLIAGLALCQIGEFSFVLAKVGLEHSMMPTDHYQIFLAASILTMTAAPFLLAAAPRLAATLVGLPFMVRLFKGKFDKEETVQQDEELRDHLIIIGFGIGGKYLARTAKLSGITYTILEMNPDTVRAFAAKGEPISHGDATSPTVLRALGVTRARVLAIVISDPAAVRGITETARHMAPGLHIIVRTRFLGEVEALRELGASDVIPEEFETGIEIFTRVLSRYLVPRANIEQFVNEIRSENYAMARHLHLPGSSLLALQKHLPDINVTAMTVENGAMLAGLSLKDSEVRRKYGLTVMAIQRGEEITGNPGGDFTIQAGDVAYVFANPTSLSASAHIFRPQTEQGIGL
ncbi:MAG: cation:proton antiporter [Desulfovibrio sp.]|jgi:CPA2 family monovalent cation:H+ antiporter-2|nr:cation:proton antiporter [Desulfovibrio sp.]